MATVILRPWAPEHLPLLLAADTADMTRFLGGSEGEDAVLRRHQNYLRSRDGGQEWMFAIEADGEGAGGIGFWTTEHDGEAAYEVGWNVLPAWQGRGIAREALSIVVDILRSDVPPLPRAYAYPSVDNAPSNALCRSAGFADHGERDFPFRGTVLRTRVWALELHPA
ncbi:GNAT family N-acetyltransferase [Microbacterium sp. AK009]|uniref:GNAT family N-acetyltransferase n=1 Tax=Microbacterium sp. AK009 TaxID=2723068 RepID=UPI001C53BF78|nr:GNAT family N-acetyltransferase [Microbacterium sp. AK009]